VGTGPDPKPWRPAIKKCEFMLPYIYIMETEVHKPELSRRLERFLCAVPRNAQRLVKAADFMQAGFHGQELARLVERGELQRVQRGVYAVTEHGGAALSHIDRVLELQRRFPQAVLCLSSAVSWLGLSTEEPFEVDLALHRERTGHLPVAPGAHFHWMTTTVFEFGQVADTRYGVPVRVFTAAKTVADLCRRRNTLGLVPYLGALKAYLEHGGEDGSRGATAPLLAAAQVCRVEPVIRRDLSVLYG
jgi:Transcriptional regulator, AbiEi antitoxin